MNKNIFLFFIFILILQSVFSNTLNVAINTQYPSQSPYFIGTHVKDIKFWFTDEDNKIINKNLSYIDFTFGNKEFRAIKKQNYYFIKTNFYITDDCLNGNDLILKVTTPLEDVGNLIQKYSVYNPKDFLSYSFSNLANVYNPNQDLNLNLNFSYKKSVSNPICNLKFDLKNTKKMTCNDDSCSLFFKTPDANKLDLNIFCVFLYLDNQTMPLYIHKKIKISHDIKIILNNPKDGVITNPFNINFSLNYINNKPITANNISVFLDNKEKVVSYLGGNKYKINYFLMPYTNFNHIFKFKINNTMYLAKYNIDLKPGSWFWYFIIILILIILANIILVVIHFIKKPDLDALIEERDNLVLRLKTAKEQYLKGLMTKTTYDTLLEENEFKISQLNQQILKIKEKNSKPQITKQLNTIKNINKPFEEKHKQNKDLDSLLDELDTVKKEPKQIIKPEPIIEKKPLYSKDNLQKGNIQPITESKPKEKELDEINLSGMEFDINKWKKK